MSNFIVEPNPKVIITDADSRELSLLSFHIVVIVEPDPETWMGSVEMEVGDVIQLFNEGLHAELDPESDIYRGQTRILLSPDEVDRPILLWVKYTGEDNLFDEPAYTADVTFRLSEYDNFEHLGFYLQGIKQSHPNWNVAIVGGMFEDDVIRIANFISEIGFPTTVVTRQCISRNVFVNLDELMIYQAWLDKYRITGNDFPDDIDDLFEE